MDRTVSAGLYCGDERCALHGNRAGCTSSDSDHHLRCADSNRKRFGIINDNRSGMCHGHRNGDCDCDCDEYSQRHSDRDSIDNRDGHSDEHRHAGSDQHTDEDTPPDHRIGRIAGHG